MSRWTVEEPRRFSFDEPVTSLVVHLIAGRLNVVGTDGPARVEIAAHGGKPLIIEHENGQLAVRHEIKKWSWIGWPEFSRWFGLGKKYRADVSIAVPTGTRARLRVVSGTAIASGLREDTDVDVTSGRITLMGLGGRTVAKLVSGPVEALGIVGDLTMETVSGELVLADSPAQRVHARAVSGSITCDLDNPRDSEIRLGTVSGGVTLRIREDSDLSVQLHTDSGRITSAFPELRSGDGPSWSRDVHGVLGSGAGKLWANTSSGSISLLARPAPDPEDVE
ncbi:DUF4097 family beta strand repeat-containing protein [Micromonospora sp. CPCC 206061]|uniref:DUF4097 family beta strand repeat-containing protein n=1 Tax=Micromonospora sp. CPCC 206061 TaxID=3122410 RepID=UPI002FF35F39